SVKRQALVHVNPCNTAATHCAPFHRSQGGSYGTGVDSRIRIHKEKPLATGSARARVAGGGNLSVILCHHACLVLPSYFSCRIHRRIIHADNLERSTDDTSGLLNRPQWAGKARLLVMGWNDE